MLSQVDAFCKVMTLKELLDDVKIGVVVEKEDTEVQEFCRSTLVLVEKEVTTAAREKATVDYAGFMKMFESLLGSKKLNINDFMSEKYEHFPSNHIQKKDIQSRVR